MHCVPGCVIPAKAGIQSRISCIAVASARMASMHRFAQAHFWLGSGFLLQIRELPLDSSSCLDPQGPGQ